MQVPPFKKYVHLCIRLYIKVNVLVQGIFNFELEFTAEAREIRRTVMRHMLGGYYLGMCHGCDATVKSVDRQRKRR